MIRAQSPISWFPARSRLTLKGLSYTIAAALVLAIIATIVKAATGHSIAGWLVVIMVGCGVLSLLWDFVTDPRKGN